MAKKRPPMDNRRFMIAILDQGWARGMAWARAGFGVRIVRGGSPTRDIVTR
jgi:hypothetical protein